MYSYMPHANIDDIVHNLTNRSELWGMVAMGRYPGDHDHDDVDIVN